MTADQRYASWLEQLEHIIQDVYRLNHHRQLFREVADITQAANLPPSAFFDAVGGWYADSQTAAIRRLVDRRRRSVSLVRLLDEIRQHPDVTSRARHVALWNGDPHFEREGHDNYDRFADASGERIDRLMVQADIDELNGAAAAVERYVDENIAHRALAPKAAVPTFAELNAAIDAIGEIVRKYASLLRAVMLAELTPVIQYDWKAPFRQPWLSEDD